MYANLGSTRGENMKIFLQTSLLTTMLALGGGLAFADHHEVHKAECNCTKECAENCKKGQSKDCKCEHGECKKTGDCGESCTKKK